MPPMVASASMGFRPPGPQLSAGAVETGWSALSERARTAVYLVINSPEFTIDK